MKAFCLKRLLVAAAVASVAALAQGQTAEPSPQSAGARALREIFDYLTGQWEGEATGSPHGAGSFAFEFALDGHAVVRRSRTDFPATKEQAATHHEDLIVVYGEGGQIRADYVDNESHVIHYTVSFAAESGIVTFVSPIVEGQPRFRLIYRPLSKDRVEVAFEMAPPGKPTTFGTYLKGVSRRRQVG